MRQGSNISLFKCQNPIVTNVSHPSDSIENEEYDIKINILVYKCLVKRTKMRLLKFISKSRTNCILVIYDTINHISFNFK